MIEASDIQEHAEVVGADGVHIGTVDRIEDGRIKLTKADSGGAGYGGGHDSHHHYIPLSLVSGVDNGGRVRLSANGDVAVTFEEEEAGGNIAGRGGDMPGGRTAMAAETMKETHDRQTGPDTDRTAEVAAGATDTSAYTDTPGSNPGAGIAGGHGMAGSMAIHSDGGEFAQERKMGYRSGGV